MVPPYGAVQRSLEARLRVRCLARMVVALLLLSFPAIAGSRPVRLLVFGDSLAAGYGLAQPDGFQAQLGTALRADGFDVTILDGGVSGDTTAGGRARLDWALADKPDAVLVELGGNDGLRATEPHVMEANLTAILDTLQKGHIPALLSGMVAPPNLGAPFSREFLAVFDRLGKRPGLIYDPFFLEGVAGDPALNQPDHIHPNAEGVRHVVARIKPAVEQLLREVHAAS